MKKNYLSTSTDLWKSNPQDSFSQSKKIHATDTNVVIGYETIKATKDKEYGD